tara:strand:- start:655 stop:1128 length:474 start_codon:yes stop_codon:yes gene_type:complete
MNNSKLYILTFIITGLWDIVLRFLSEGYEDLPNFMKYDFIKYLQPYFKKHTLLAAALIAGFIGATTQFIIINIHKFPNHLSDFKTVMIFMGISFIVSALYGFIMKMSKLFPHMEDTYYKNLEMDGGVLKSMFHDGVSGIIVQVSIYVLLLINKNIIK